MSVPSGVKTYGHKEASSSGRFHPTTLGGGPNTTTSDGGGFRPSLGEVGGSGGSSSVPGSVRGGDGTENVKADGSRFNQRRSLPSQGADTSKRPGGVHVATGVSTPKGVK